MSEEKKFTSMNWGPFVMRATLSSKTIDRLLMEGRKTKQSYHKHLAGHLDRQYLYPIEIQQWFYSEISEILDLYRVEHCRYHDIECLPIELGFDDLWINFMEAGDFNPQHTHGGDYSFVVFLDVPDELRKEQIEFEGKSAKPGSLMFEFTQQARPRWATTGRTVVPVTGEIYLFPALLQHWVVPFKSKATRVSVSGNIRILNRDKLPSDYF